MDKMLERFLRYVQFDTKSDEDNENCPSSSGQTVFGKELVKELIEMGISDAYQDAHGYVYASLDGNVSVAPTMGLIAHMDTAPDLSGKGVNPQILEYKGGDIRLNDQYTTSVKEFPFLKNLEGQTLITTDGTTLLGADDKAGVAIIMTVVEYLKEHPEMPHGKLKIGFTPDEEIGRGADLFDVEKFAADFAYTIDGGPVGELEYENFNAASVKLKIQGKNVHPGTAKNVMLNSLRVAFEFEQMLPVEQKPEYTEGYEGFFLLGEIQGTVDFTEVDYIIRDHSMEKFVQKKELVEKAVQFLNEKYGDVIILEMKDSYYNMKEKIEPHMEIIDLAKQAMEELGIEPMIKPIRGGTDGARLSYMGLPTPNLFTGGYNYHGRFELISYEGMKQSVSVILKMIENNAK
ncbi:MAG: peptidase T [Tissierellia bacterium]|nr:peptidase T [Tissierellia bacterium]